MRIRTVVMALAFTACAAGSALCADTAPLAAARQGDPGFFAATAAAVIIGLAIVGGLCGIAMGGAIARAIEGIARQPDAAPKIQFTMFIGAALIESLVLYTLFICIILLFANPFIQYVVK